MLVMSVAFFCLWDLFHNQNSLERNDLQEAILFASNSVSEKNQEVSK